jgi:hypothetical protein
MEIFFNDPNIERKPPSDTRLLNLQAALNSDGKRLRITLEITPFQQSPNIELSLTDPSGTEVASASIIEPVGWKLELTLHIRKSAVPAKYTFAASLLYPELGEVDRHILIIEIPFPAQ